MRPAGLFVFGRSADVRNRERAPLADNGRKRIHQKQTPPGRGLYLGYVAIQVGEIRSVLAAA
jgi:hypothetical protein